MPFNSCKAYNKNFKTSFFVTALVSAVTLSVLTENWAIETNSIKSEKAISILTPSEYLRIFGMCLVILFQYI